MGELTLELDELRDILAVARHEFSTLEHITRKLTSIVAAGDDAEGDPLVRSRLADIDRGMTVALDRQTSLAHAMKECRRNLRRQAGRRKLVVAAL